MPESRAERGERQSTPGKGSTGSGINIWRSPELDSSEGFSASCEGLEVVASQASYGNLPNSQPNHV